MERDDIARTLVEVGQRLDREGQRASCEGFSAVSLLKELAIDLVPTLVTAGPPVTVHSTDTVADAARAEPEPGPAQPQMGRFRLKGEIGRGGMGRVYEARDPELRRSVAVKCFADSSRATAEALGRFVAEAQITAQLEHPNIVPVYDIGITVDGQLYFVMRRVQGRSLRDVLLLLSRGDVDAAREWTQHRLLGVFVQICHAVAYAHERGVVHRDLKPSNVMLGEFGQVLVMDWGIARLVEDRQAEPVDRVQLKKTEWGRAIGTPGYMSPEQLLGQHATVDARSDVFSLGAILFEMVTCQRAFAGSEEEITEKVLTGRLKDPRSCERGSSVPDEVAEVVLRALDIDSARRFQNASELAAAVESYLEGSGRREAAVERTAEAEAVWKEYVALEQQLNELTRKGQDLARQVPPWATLAEKIELLANEERLDHLRIYRAEVFARVVNCCERALELLPEGPVARTLLARAYARRMVEAEAERDVSEQRFFESRVRAYDDGSMAVFLEGVGALSLTTDPDGAQVVCQRYEQRGLTWSLGPPEVLGHTPLEAHPLPMGSYRLTLRARGKRDTIYPIHITRGRWWVSGDTPVRLYSDAEIGQGFVYVPPGPFVCGGDPLAPGSLPRDEVWLPGFFIGVHPATMEQYLAFINAVHAVDPELAWSRVPRAASSPSGSSGEYWRRPGRGERYVIPDLDADGDRWSPA
jgi:serine/threonine-protein kinase